MSEVALKNTIKKILKPTDCKILHRDSPDWLGEQHLDIFIPALDLAIEYMGRQHYEPVKFFGGEKAFEENKRRDKAKKMKCKKNDVNLIQFKYDEPMEPEHIAERICEKSELEMADIDLDVEVPNEDELDSYQQ